MKKYMKIMCVMLIITCLMHLGIYAAANLQKITAYLNYDIAVKLDGNEQLMYDANGKRVYPISYEGTTYVPIRAVSNMLGVNVAWDADSYSVLLGKTGIEQDFIETIKPYNTDAQPYMHRTIADNRSATIHTTVYNHYICISEFSRGDKLFYDLSGLYETLTFDMYCLGDFQWSSTDYAIVDFYGDNGVLIDSVTIDGMDLPKHYEIDVSGVQQFIISVREDPSGVAYLYNMYIK